MAVKYKYLRLIIKLKRNPLIARFIDFIKVSYEKTKQTNSQLRIQFFQFIPFFVASSLSGIAAFIYYKLFVIAENVSLYIYEKNNYFIFILTPVFFLISWWLVKRFSPYAKGSGIPQVMASLELSKPETRSLINHLLGIKIIVIKVLISILRLCLY